MGGRERTKRGMKKTEEMERGNCLLLQLYICLGWGFCMTKERERERGFAWMWLAGRVSKAFCGWPWFWTFFIPHTTLEPHKKKKKKHRIDFLKDLLEGSCCTLHPIKSNQIKISNTDTPSSLPTPPPHAYHLLPPTKRSSFIPPPRAPNSRGPFFPSLSLSLFFFPTQ